jgi:hypothetical protein
MSTRLSRFNFIPQYRFLYIGDPVSIFVANEVPHQETPDCPASSRERRPPFPLSLPPWTVEGDMPMIQELIIGIKRAGDLQSPLMTRKRHRTRIRGVDIVAYFKEPFADHSQDIGHIRSDTTS